MGVADADDDDDGEDDKEKDAPPTLVGDDDDVDDVHDDDKEASNRNSDVTDNRADVDVVETVEDEDEGRRKSGRMSFRNRQETRSEKMARQSVSSRPSISAARRRSSNVRGVRRSSVRLSRSARDQKASGTA